VRISLPQGTYQMQITAFDANDSAATPLTYKNTVKVNFDSEKVCFSDIQALSILTEATEESNFTKYGYDYFPYFSTFYPENITKLFYSVEIYNLEKIGKEKNFYAVGYIAQEGTNSPFSKEFQQEKKLQNSSQNLLIQRFPIDSLPSGNYNLMIDVKDEQGVLYGSTSMFFQRSNPSVVAANTAAIDSLPLDTLKLYLNYIYPAAEKEERAFINNVKSSDYAAIADFFQNFWYKRDPNNPQAAWLKYYKMVMRVNNNYSTLRFKGYKTDRGNCYLRYGPPNYIEYNTSEVNSYAYEIWTYYDFPATSQSNVYFVFYQKDLTTRDFRLLHSNAIGELQDPDWKKILGTDISMPDDNRMKKETINTNDYVY
jgi:GWxTD domain-containing protein